MPKGKKKLGSKKKGKKGGKGGASITGQSAAAGKRAGSDGAATDSGSVLMPKPLPTQVPMLGENLLHVLKTHHVEEKELHNIRVTVNALQELTPQEIRDLKLVFDVFDSDLDGNLTMDEVRMALRALGFGVTADKVYRMVVELNKGVAATDFNTFLAYVIDRQGDARDTHDEIVHAFKYFDIDGTGKITVSNLKQICRQYKVHISEPDLEEMIQEADNNGDNAVDVEEFVNIMMQTHMYS